MNLPPLEEKTTRLTLLRHGTTEGMEKGLLHGASDSPLSTRGREEALKTAEALRGIPFDVFLTSSSHRAVETASLIGSRLAADFEATDDFRERNFGLMEGTRLPRNSPKQGLRSVLRNLWFALVTQLTGEPVFLFTRRIREAFLKLLEIHGGKSILLVTHHAVRRRLIGALASSPKAKAAAAIPWPSCAFTVLEIRENGPVEVIVPCRSDHLV